MKCPNCGVSLGDQNAYDYFREFIKQILKLKTDVEAEAVIKALCVGLEK